MAAVIPEVVGAAAGAGDVAAGAGASRGASSFRFGGAASGQGADPDTGSPAAFMIAIVLLVCAMLALWLAFHNPAEWDAEGGQFPGLAARIIQWMSGHAEGTTGGTSGGSGSGGSGSGGSGGGKSGLQKAADVYKWLNDHVGLAALAHLFGW